MLTGAFHVLGANTTLFEASLKKESVTIIDFVSQGVPEQAIVLSVNYTGQGELLSDPNSPERSQVRSA